MEGLAVKVTVELADTDTDGEVEGQLKAVVELSWLLLVFGSTCGAATCAAAMLVVGSVGQFASVPLTANNTVPYTTFC